MDYSFKKKTERKHAFVKKKRNIQGNKSKKTALDQESKIEEKTITIDSLVLCVLFLLTCFLL